MSSELEVEGNGRDKAVRAAVVRKHLELLPGRRESETEHLSLCQFCTGNFQVLCVQGFIPQTTYQRDIMAKISGEGDTNRKP